MADNKSGTSNVLVFIIGGLVVAVVVIGWFVYNGSISVGGSGKSESNNTDITIQAPAAPAAPST